MLDINEKIVKVIMNSNEFEMFKSQDIECMNIMPGKFCEIIN